MKYEGGGRETWHFVHHPRAGQIQGSMFLDNCHLTKEGEEVKAQILFDELKHNPIFTHPVPL